MSSPHGGFRRRLSPESLEVLLNDPVCKRVVEAVKHDDCLDLQLRGSYVDVYYAGFSVFQIKTASRAIRLGSEIEKTQRPHPWTKTWMTLDEVKDTDDDDINAAVDWVKTERAPKLANEGRETEFESHVVRDNHSKESSVIVLDRQIVQPGWRMRLDLIMYDVASERLVLAELKLLSNPEAAGDVFKQLLLYQGLLANNPGIAASYPHIYEQKAALGLIDHDLDMMRVDRPPLLLYLLGGYKDELSKGKKERVNKSAETFRKEYGTLRVHMHALDDYRREGPGCRLPSPVADLPLFNEWAKDSGHWKK